MLWLAAASLAAPFAQAPVVGDIDFYGLRSVTPERILSAIQLKPGDRIPPSKGDLEDRIADIPGVVLARVEAVCCDGRTAALFIGVEERGAPHTELRSPPAGDVVLPQEAIDLYNRFLAAVRAAAGRGTTSDSASRELQAALAGYAAAHFDLLGNVLLHDAEEEQRTIAAALIGYAPKKADAVSDLQLALQDPDESVRANAARALNAIAVLASRQPTPGPRIEPTWAINLLHSVVLSDRVEAVKLLLTLTDRPAPAVLEQIREQALPNVVEMARWKTPSYALPPFLLAGRLAGMPDAQVEAAWQKGDRDAVLQKLQPKR